MFHNLLHKGMILKTITEETLIFVSWWGNSTKLTWSSTTAKFCRRKLQPWQLLRRQSWVLSWVQRADINNKFTQSFQVGVLMHVWICPKLCQTLSQLDLKNELSYEVGFFCMWLVRNSWKIQICSIILIGCGKGCPKWLETTKLYLKNEIRYEFDFLHVVRHTKVHLYDLFHSYKCGQSQT